MCSIYSPKITSIYIGYFIVHVLTALTLSRLIVTRVAGELDQTSSRQTVYERAVT